MIDVIMPKMGESITEGTILEWKKAVGDKVELDEPLLEISTDKVDSEIPSPGTGILSEVLFKVNEVVQVGEIIARIRDSKDEILPQKSFNENERDEHLEDDNRSGNTQIGSHSESTKKSKIKKRFISPLVRAIINENGISELEVESIPGSGASNRITKKDILSYLNEKNKNNFKKNGITGQNTGISQTEPPVDNPELEIETPTKWHLTESRTPMDRVRKRIAEHMTNSQRTSAHVYSTAEADVTRLVDIRLKYKNAFRTKYGINLTYTPMIMYSAVQAIQEFPLMNSSIENFEILSHQNINMGLAVALPNNNLIVPVVNRCEELNFLGLARQSSILAEKARTGALTPEDIFGSTFTVTNPGVFGGLMGMAIINQPNVGILSVGAFQKRPVVKETDFGDTIVVRHMVYLTLSYDHRIIDGAYGTKFLTRICEYLEAFEESKVA